MMNQILARNRTVKIKKIHRLLARTLLKSKRLYIFIALIVIASLGVGWHYRAVTANTGNKNDMLLSIYQDTLSTITILIIIVPFFLYLIEFVVEVFNKCNVLLKYRNLKQWWYDENISMLIFSVIFTFIINIVILITILFIGKISIISIDMIKFLIVGFFLQIAGFLILSSIFNIVVLLVNHPFLGFPITYFIILPFSIIGYIFHNPRASMLALNEYMFLGYKENIIININDIFKILWLVLIYLIICLIGYFIVKDKDIYWKA